MGLHNKDLYSRRKKCLLGNINHNGLAEVPIQLPEKRKHGTGTLEKVLMRSAFRCSERWACSTCHIVFCLVHARRENSGKADMRLVKVWCFIISVFRLISIETISLYSLSRLESLVICQDSHEIDHYLAFGACIVKGI